MGFYKELFSETELEKELKRKKQFLENSFHLSPEYKRYIESINKIDEQIKNERKRHWDETFKKQEEKRKRHPVKPQPLIVDPVENERLLESEKKIDKILDLIEPLTKSEKENFMYGFNIRYGYKGFDKYENPVTTIQDIKDLQEALVQTVINFLDDRKLTDIDEVHFNFDAAQDSVKEYKWCPASDSTISVIGLQKEKDSGMTARRLIGQYY